MHQFFHTLRKRTKALADKLEAGDIRKKARITYGVFWNIILITTILLFLGGVFAGGVGAGYFASLVKDEKVRPADSMKKDIYQYEESSKLYFADNIYLGKLQSDIDREEVDIHQVSDYLKKAVIATEDEYFYEHDGVVPKALMRAVYQELSNSAVQTGGSTLTQQLIKNQILTNEVSFDRKAKEILLALRLEKFLDKDEILEAYLNVTTFGRNSSGQNIGGVQAAARGIFGVDANDLNLPQAAFIAGLPQSPFMYTPFAQGGGLKEEKQLEPGLNRMKTVLYRMYRENYITKEEYDKALAYDIVGDFIEPQPRPFEKYPWLMTEIEERGIKILTEILAEKDGYNKEDLEKDNGKLKGKYQTLAERDIRQNGYHIHTTINKEIYDKFQKIKDEYNNYGYTKVSKVKNEETGKMEEVIEPVQIGAILIENKTGKILSFVGGRDHSVEATNHATNAKRQNGSTMKPLLVYAPAIEMGLSAPGAVVADIPISVGGKVFKNYSTGRYYGLVSSRKALAYSYNASTIYTYLKTIDKEPYKYVEKMGITTLTDTDRTTYAAALGGIEQGVTVEENTNAFTTFANGGKFIDAYMIEKITDADGNVVYERKSKPVDVFSPQTAYLMTDMMRDVFKYGTAAAVPGMLKFSADWAGKTGTTTGPNDAWLVGSNPNVTFGTWIGYGQPAPLSSDGSESRRNYGIWASLINGAYDAVPDLIAPSERFKMPGGIVSRSYCAISGLLPSEACSSLGLVESDIFNAKFVPTKVDDSLGNGRYVTINGKNYMALPETPEEFTKPGGTLSPEFVKRISLGMSIDPSLLIPPNDSRWKNLLAAGAVLKDDGKAPAAVKAAISGNTISWSPSSSKDVVGYRIYSESGNKVASVLADGTLTHKVGDGIYYVVAVDIAGRESSPSNDLGAQLKENGEEEAEKTATAVEKKKQAEKDKAEAEKKKLEEQKQLEEQKKKEEEQKQKQQEEQKKEEETKEQPDQPEEKEDGEE
ncbi:transglycosylase domain-containing protein [Siminovitchia sediminis]|uniref:Transglycosylase domain-containing protein n=1 Tax=Siminovitchia sediminis TaxID=1274353 RepID=A0ABW4KI20_9BACI